MKRTLESMIITAVKPWKASPPELEEAVFVRDTQENIDFCLNHCPYADSDCCDCLSGGTHKRFEQTGRPNKIDLEQLAEMLTLKRTNQEMCSAFGVTKSTVIRAKKRLANLHKEAGDLG